ncbi:MAG: epoxyqueuosine reductase [Euryarchaeota archaeon]|nr:epoxyqueuosine reductase [Euryarchaeota archaeon]
MAAGAEALLRPRFELLREVERLAREEGMDLFGCYSGAHAVPLTGFTWARSVVVFGLGIGEKELLLGVRQRGWSRARQFVDLLLDLTACRISNLLLRHGHESEVIGSSQAGVDIRRLAVVCGLGTIGRNGLLITPEHGPRVRLAGVATSAPLPGEARVVRELCLECNACAEACPAGAIGEGFNEARCREYNLRLERGASFRKCSLCTDVCPGGATPGP